MSRNLAVLFSILFFSSGLWAQDTFKFDDPQKQALFLELNGELRCPKCQNQNIADSDAMIALDLKRKVYQLLQEGKSKQEVIDFMKVRYGEFVHYKPPVTPVTIWLWLLPLLFVLGGVVWLISKAKKHEPVQDEDALKKAEELLEKMK